MSFLKRFDMYNLYSLKRTGPLFEDGWFRSARENKSVDLEGNPIPWFTYPAIEFLRRRIHTDITVFEFGAGNGTFWWARQVKTVVSVEHDKIWYEQLIKSIPSNVQLHFIELVYGGSYSKKISEYDNQFDIIVIDGRDRVNCAKHSLKALKSGGVIIWDNSDRVEYHEGYDFLFREGFRKLEFIGLIPTINYKSETSIFYRGNNCLFI